MLSIKDIIPSLQFVVKINNIITIVEPCIYGVTDTKLLDEFSWDPIFGSGISCVLKCFVISSIILDQIYLFMRKFI